MACISFPCVSQQKTLHEEHRILVQKLDLNFSCKNFNVTKRNSTLQSKRRNIGACLQTVSHSNKAETAKMAEETLAREKTFIKEISTRKLPTREICRVLQMSIRVLLVALPSGKQSPAETFVCKKQV